MTELDKKVLLTIRDNKGISRYDVARKLGVGLPEVDRSVRNLLKLDCIEPIDGSFDTRNCKK